MNYNNLIERLRTESLNKAAEATSALGLYLDVESLVTELSEERYRHDRLQDFEVAQAQELERVKAERAALKNELCYKCGNYKQAHNGWCDSCRWKKGKEVWTD